MGDLAARYNADATGNIHAARTPPQSPDASKARSHGTVQRSSRTAPRLRYSATAFATSEAKSLLSHDMN